MELSIGIFDSGFGGLTVMQEIVKKMPNENIVYFGDTARVPYGNKSKETICRFADEISNFLCSKNIKILVVACNTASSFALEFLQKKLDIPVVGVIEPGAKSAFQISKNKKIGVIGTKGTISSWAYQNALKNLDKNIEVFGSACPLFVPLVEEGWIDKKVTYEIVEEYLKDLKKEKIDSLILGCTHYPILKHVIQKVMGEKVEIVDSAKETAKYVYELLKEKGMLNTNTKNTKYSFFVSDDPEKFKQLGKIFLGCDINKVEEVCL